MKSTSMLLTICIFIVSSHILAQTPLEKIHTEEFFAERYKKFQEEGVSEEEILRRTSLAITMHEMAECDCKEKNKLSPATIEMFLSLNKEKSYQGPRMTEEVLIREGVCSEKSQKEIALALILLQDFKMFIISQKNLQKKPESILIL